MTTAMYSQIGRQIDKAGFDQTSDIARRIADEHAPLTKAERLMLGKRLAQRLAKIDQEAGTL